MKQSNYLVTWLLSSLMLCLPLVGMEEPPKYAECRLMEMQPELLVQALIYVVESNNSTIKLLQTFALLRLVSPKFKKMLDKVFPELAIFFDKKCNEEELEEYISKLHELFYRLLLSVNERGKCARTLLYGAVKYKRSLVGKILLRLRASKDLEDSWKQSPSDFAKDSALSTMTSELQISFYHQDYEGAEKLLRNQKIENPTTVAGWIIKSVYDKKIFEKLWCLIKWGKQSVDYQQLVRTACTCVNACAFEYLKKNSDLDYKPLLLTSAEQGFMPALEWYVADCKRVIKPVEVSSFVDSTDWTPLMHAAFYGHLSVVKYLVEQRADIDKASYTGWTPLIFAAFYGHLSVVKYLVEQRAAIDKANDTGSTPLILAARSGYLDVVRYLVEQKADTDKADNHGWTPLIHAARSGYLDVVRCLVEQKADTEKADNHKWTPLMHAAHSGYLGVVKYLVEQGADIDKVADNGLTVLDYARYNSETEVGSYLGRYGQSDSLRR